MRTHRRRIHELLRQMGATSRFQAGVIAQERHYIELVTGDRSGASSASLYLEALKRARSAPAAQRT